MENKTFVQTRLTHRIEATFDDDGIIVYDKGLLTETRYKIYYDQIEEEPIEGRPISKLWLGIILLSVFGLIYTIIEFIHGADWFKYILLYFGAFIISCAVFWFKTTMFFIIPAGMNPLVLYKDKPNKQEFDEFISELYARKTSYCQENDLFEEEDDL